jgi:polysaccharide biosynthesis protein PslG
VRRAVVLAALLVAVVPAASASAANTLSAYGIGSLRTEWIADDANGVWDLGLMGSSSLGLYRARFRQDVVLSGGAYSNWGPLDNMVRQAALKGVTIQPILINMPGEVYTPPKTDAELVKFGQFAAQSVRRYGPAGTFWAGCGCPKLAIRVWEVWNEPNIAPFWDVPNASQYAALLVAAKAKLRKADPNARVLFGGLAYPATTNSQKLEANSFLSAVVAAAGPDSFDALAVHTFRADAAEDVDTLIKGTVDALKAAAGTKPSGAPRQQVWVNEFGRYTAADDPATPADEQAAAEQVQLTWLNGLLDRLLPHRTDWNLGPILWYAIRDSYAPTATWHRYGLRRTNPDNTDAGAKPAWNAYVGRAAGAAAVPLPTLR